MPSADEVPFLCRNVSNCLLQAVAQEVQSHKILLLHLPKKVWGHIHINILDYTFQLESHKAISILKA